MIRRCIEQDFEAIGGIINDGARRYQGVIPADRWKDPYMSPEELRHEINEGVEFWGYETGGTLVGVMGLQHVKEVMLIRHAYVLTSHQNQGIGAKLLSRLTKSADRPVLIGTWAAASWAIRFYEKHGFRLVSREEKERLLSKYWNIPQRQVESSVVLADPKWPGWHG
ncbi:MAG TPA: GNAT family N-acetyltransferase [Candidatus Sulfotelmatobacter sp.]|nr:GNAT family N-acetyltransferase [Candidatus Sulfotelmatobacter sp.]